MKINKSKVKNLCEFKVLFVVIHFKVQVTYTQEILEFNKGAMWIIHVEERYSETSSHLDTLSKVECVLVELEHVTGERRVDTVACWFIHTHVDFVLGPKTEGNMESGTRNWKTWSRP
jgi:hypothetical protein